MQKERKYCAKKHYSASQTLPLILILKAQIIHTSLIVASRPEPNDPFNL